MSSPLSRPFSVFPKVGTSQRPYHCLYPSCPYHASRPLDLERHHAIFHSSMGHSPISALNLPAVQSEGLPGCLSPITPSSPSSPISPLELPPIFDTPSPILPAYPFPAPPSLPPPSTCPSRAASRCSSSSSIRHLKAIVTSAFSSPASSSTSSIRKRSRGERKRAAAARNRAGTYTQCGRHGDQWLGLAGWKFWR